LFKPLCLFSELQCAGARLLESLAVTVRPPLLLTLAPLPDVLRDPCAVLAGLPLEVQLMVFKVLTAACVLPWHNAKVQVWVGGC
jgi:hypothetical protein